MINILPPHLGEMHYIGMMTAATLEREAAVLIIVGFVIAAVVGAAWMPAARKWGLLQHAYEDAPQTHQTKTGTPTMGGICFVAGLLPLVLVAAPPDSNLHQIFWLVVACAGIGALDDYIGIRYGKNRGLRARTKFLLTAFVAIVFLRSVSESTALTGWLLALPHYVLIVPYWLWLLLGVLAIAGTINAVNLTDGLDGLATGSIIPPLMVIGFIALQEEAGGFFGGLGALLGIGACLGFLIYNRHPAKLFMGDTGSLALGALLSGSAILQGQMLLLILIGGVFVAEALSVILQVAYFKVTHGKRIFKMSPLHHHFELSGWPETKVTTRFWIASAICSAIGLAIVR